MAISTKTKEYVALTYAKYFGRTADADTISNYALIGKTSKILKQIIKDANIEQYSVHGDNLEAEVHNEFQNLFSRNADNTELQKYVKVLKKGKDLPINSIVKKATKFDKDVYNNKQEIAKYVAQNGGREFDLSKVTKANPIKVESLTSLDDLKAKIDALPENSNVPSTFDGETYTLTIDVNTFKGTAKDDTFLSSTINHWSVGDSIDGGKGVDTLKIIDATAAIAQTNVIPTGSTIKNVEILDIISGGGAVTADTTSIEGVAHLYTTSTGANDSTAAETTNINATATAGAIIVDGGKDVTVVSKANVGNDITVGGATAAAGTVTTVINDGYVDADDTTADITALGNTTINGGTKINASSKVEFTAAQITAAKTIANSDTVAQGTVTVNGNASTTEVTVSQTAEQATVGYVLGTSDGQIGITAGDVNINDVNKGDNTKAGTIETVTVKNADDVIVDSGALKTLNLEGTITSVDATSTGSKATVDTLALNLNGVDMSGTAAIDTDVKTLNIKSSTNASTIGATTTDATAINISGDAKLTLTALTLNATAGNEVITVTNTAGVTIGSTLDTDVTFTGGAGDDAVKLLNNFTKAITMGAGNDKVTVGGTDIGTGGSVAAGKGKDTIVMTVAQAESFDDNSTFNTKFTGFEVLELNTITSAGAVINLTGINAVSTVNLASAVTNALTLDNLVSGGTVRITTTPASTLDIVVKDALLTNTDVLNLELFNTTGLTTTATEVVTAANVETININVADADTAGSDADTHALELAATSATKIVVAGNNGLTLTNTANTNTKVTTFDASKVVANDTVATASAAATTDTAAKLAVTYASQTTVAATTADTVVTIIGGAGNDVLTGNDTKDTITGGAGNDTLAGAGGADIINVGEGRDIVVIGATDSTTAAFDSINGFTLATKTTAAFTDQATFLAAGTTGGSNVSILDITPAFSIKGPQTAAAGQHAGVTYTIKDGILTLGGTGASTVDTLGEWLAEANAAAGNNGDALAFQFGSDTYAFVQNGGTDILVKLVGVTGADALVDGYSNAATVDNTILIG